MSRQGRYKKTPERNLTDLDDHLYFLKDDLAKLIGGDTAYVKKIAGSLRTLVCLSSGTEGLLWRVMEQIEADDTLDLQATRGIDQNNALTQGLSFVLIPVFRAGSGPAAFKAERISLKKFIKEYEALYYNGKSYTHEKLISGIAQQMGISHESEDVEPHLIDLSGMAISHRPVLVEFLLRNASFTLEVGERALEIAERKTGFKRHSRPQVVIPPRTIEPFHFDENEHFLNRESNAKTEGTYAWVVRAPKTGWETDGRSYNLGTVTNRDITSSFIKNSDGTLEVTVYGLAPTVRIKRAPIISRGKHEIVVYFRWKDGDYRILIEGKFD